MTLSSFLLRPALTSLISGGVTDSIVTSSPAILMGFNLGGIIAGGEAWSASYTIKNGSTTIFQTYVPVLIQEQQYQPMPLGGIDCPSGITVSITGSNAQQLSNCRTTINYILK